MLVLKHIKNILFGTIICIRIAVLCVCDQHVGQGCTAQVVRSDAGVIITPHVTTSPAAACVQQAGEDRTVRKVIFSALETLIIHQEDTGKTHKNLHFFSEFISACIFCKTALCRQTQCNSFLLLQFVCLVGTGGDALNAASVLAALPVIMRPGSVAAHQALPETAVSKVSCYSYFLICVS